MFNFTRTFRKLHALAILAAGAIAVLAVVANLPGVAIPWACAVLALSFVPVAGETDEN